MNKKLTLITTHGDIYDNTTFNKIDTVDVVQEKSEYNIKHILDEYTKTNNKDLLEGITAEVHDINISGDPLIFSVSRHINSSTKPAVVHCSYHKDTDSLLLTDTDLDFFINHNYSDSKTLMFTTLDVVHNTIQIIEPYKHIVVTMDLDVYLTKVKEDVNHEFIYHEGSITND